MTRGGDRRLSATVAWTVVPERTGALAGRWAGHLATVLIQTLGAGLGGTRINGVGDLDPLDPRADADPLGLVRVSGTGPGLADGPGPWRGTVRADRLTVTGDPVDVDLPLPRLRLADARQLGPGGRWPKTPGARWRLLLEGDGYDVEVDGTWVLLAHLGTLAGWPQP